MKLTVFDFTGIYENESFDFYKREGFRSLFMDLRDISGTNCICDDYACAKIRERIEKKAGLKDDSGNLQVNFFDNGNYHYMSRILMGETIDYLKKQPGKDGNEGDFSFDLIVFDHHPDMKWTSYGDILSCGCWVLSALKDIAELNKVYIIGADKKLMEEAYTDNLEVKNRVFYYETFDAFRRMLEDAKGEALRSVYISVDKDVLSRNELVTNWDQGDMTLNELSEGLTFLKNYYGKSIIAVDVCGECTIDDPDAMSSLGFEAGNRINNLIISTFF